MAKALKMLPAEFKTTTEHIARDHAGRLRHFKVEQDNGQLVGRCLSWVEAINLAVEFDAHNEQVMA